MKAGILFFDIDKEEYLPLVRHVSREGFIPILNGETLLRSAHREGISVLNLGDFMPSSFEMAKRIVRERLDGLKKISNSDARMTLPLALRRNSGVQDEAWRSLSNFMTSEILVIETLESLVGEYKIDLIALGCDNSHIQRTLVEYARLNQIPTIQIAHGLFTRPIVEFAGNIPPLYSDFISVFGKRSRDIFVENGTDSERIFLSGAIEWDSLYISKRHISRTDARKHMNLDPDNPAILFCGSYADGSSAFFAPVCRRLLEIHKAFLAAGRNLDKKVQLLVRPHPLELKRAGISDKASARYIENYQEWLADQGLMNVRVVTGKKIESILASDVVIGMNNSSMIVESMILERPVIKMSFGEWDSNTLTEEDGLVVLREPHKLTETLENLISSATRRQANVNKQNAGIEQLNHGNDGKATKRVCQILSEVADRGIKTRSGTPQKSNGTHLGRKTHSPRLKILEVVHNFPPFQIGGTELYTFHLAKELKKIGHDVTVLFPVIARNRADYSFTPDSYEGLQIIQFNQFGKDKAGYSDYLNSEFDEPFREFLNNNKFDVIHFQHIYGLSANWIAIAKEAGSQTILKIDDLFFFCRQIHLNMPTGVHCSGPETLDKCFNCSFSAVARSNQEFKERIYRELSLRHEVLRKAYSLPDLIHTPSNFSKTMHERYGFENQNVRVIPTGIWPFEIKERIRSADGKMRIAYVGAIDRRKGIKVFLEAVELHNNDANDNIRFQIYGNHNGDKLYESMLAKTEALDCLEFCGPMDPAARSDLFAGIDLLVSPSIGENYPFLLREALFAGVPVAATQIAGVIEIVRDGENGFLFPANDPASLSRIFTRISEEPNILSTLKTDRKKIKTISQEAKELALHFEKRGPGTHRSYVKFSIIVVTYNSEDTINRCLSSIPDSTNLPFEIILIDNHSEKPIRDVVSSQWIERPNITIIENNKNLGFSKAANQGIRRARGEYVVLLNPDCILSKNSLDRIKDHFVAGVAAAGPLSNYAAGSQNMYQYINKAINSEFTLEHMADTFYQTNRGKGVETKLLIGFCLMVRKDILDSLGLLDENLFLGNDDLDLSLRISERGYKMIVATDTIVYHKGQSSFDTLGHNQKNRLMQESLDRFYAKLESKFGPGRVPSSRELWGVDILGIPSRFTRECNPILGTDTADWSDKRIAIIFDNLVRPDTTGEYCKRALSEICTCDHYLPDRLQDISGSEYDLFIYIDDGLHNDIPVQLRPNAWWVIDTHLQYDIDLEKAKRFDFVFAAQKDGAAKLRRDGIRSVYWLPLAADPEIHKRLQAEKIYDISFIGHLAEGPRNELINTIKANFESVFVGQEFFDEMARIYSQSKIVFNRSIRNDVNMRVFEAMSCGSLLMTNKISENGQDELFKPGYDLVEYEDKEDLVEKIRRYLDDDAGREKIAACGRTAILNCHTYGHRMNGLLSKVMEESENLTYFGEDAGLVSIIMVTYNGLGATQACIESIHRFTDVSFELIIVDNGSSDGTVKYLDSMTNVKVIKNEKNLGFSAANNLGINHSCGDYILLLNNDTIVTSGWLRKMKRAINLAPEIGLAGPMTNHAFSFVQCIEDGSYNSETDPHEFAADFAKGSRSRFIPTVEKLVGFCLLIKREVINRIGVLDEAFGTGNFEDDDFCLRARLAGFGSIVAGDAFVYHEGGHSFKTNRISYQEKMSENLQIFKKKWRDKVEFRGEVYYLKSDLKKYSSKEIRLGEDAFGREDTGSAKEHFMRALEWDPDSSEALNNLGVLEWQNGKSVAAAQYFMQAIKNSPTYTDAIENLIQISANTQLPEKTLKEIYEICSANNVMEKEPA